MRSLLFLSPFRVLLPGISSALPLPHPLAASSRRLFFLHIFAPAMIADVVAPIELEDGERRADIHFTLGGTEPIFMASSFMEFF